MSTQSSKFRPGLISERAAESAQEEKACYRIEAKGKKIVITERTAKAITPLLHYCRQEKFQQIFPMTDEDAKKNPSYLELFRSFPNGFYLSLQIRGADKDDAYPPVLTVYLLEEELYGGPDDYRRVYDFDEFPEGYCNEFLISPDCPAGIVPRIAFIIDTVARKSRHEALSEHLWRYVNETFYNPAGTISPIVSAAYLVTKLCYCGLLIKEDKKWTFDQQAANQLRAEIPGRILVTYDGIDPCHASVAVETIILMARTFRCSHEQLTYIFRNVLRDQYHRACLCGCL